MKSNSYSNFTMSNEDHLANEDHLEAKVNDIKKKVKEINMPEPETCKPPDTLISTEYLKRKQPRPPHCKTCGHPVKDHHIKPKIKICTICPGQECSSSNKDTETQCPCKWHLQAGQNQTQTSRSSDCRYKVDKNVYLTTTEYILPNGLSQFSLSSNGFNSNACTVISVLVGLRFLQEDLNIPTGESEDIFQTTLQQYREIMIEGHTLYSIINPPSEQPNLTVEDVLSSINFPLEEMPFVAVNNHLSFAAELSKMNKMPETRHANILIVPPDKSMVVIQDKENVCLLDSHDCHKDKGGLIMTCNVDNFE